MQIVNIKLENLKPYERNPRDNELSVDAVANSIERFGFKVPIVVDKNNVIVTGHTRLKAAKMLGLTEVPCIIADDLTPQQVKAFRLADNKVGENSEWNIDLLLDELDDILDFDMSEFGFEDYAAQEADAEAEAEYEHAVNREKTRDRLFDIHNFGKGRFDGVGKYDIPIIEPVYELPEIKEWIGFNYVLSDDEPEGKAVHFFIDDYQFERVWNEPERYLDRLSRYVCVGTPDFSPYMDMPMATQIFNHFRKHWLGAYWQRNGITVIPTIRASADERSLEWYLDGEPKNGIVLISSMWTKEEADKDYFINKEYKGMIDALDPCKVFVYGKKHAEISGNVEYINTFTEKRYGG